MTTIVNSWDEWSPLKRVIMGRPEGTNTCAPEPAWWEDCPTGGYPLGTWGPFPQEMVDAANEQMDSFQAELEKRAVLVERVAVQDFMFNKALISPNGWAVNSAYGVNNVRDLTLVHGNYIIESATCRRSRHHERYNLRSLFEGYFNADPNVVHIAAPPPMLTDDSYVRNYYYNFRNIWTDEEKRQKLYNWEFMLTEKEPLWDAADALRCGKDIILGASAVTNRSGWNWVKRMFSALGIRVHLVEFDTPMGPHVLDNFHPWHIDCNLAALRPGLCMINPDWAPRTPQLYDLFKKNDWELVESVRPQWRHQNVVSHSQTMNDLSWIGMNTLSIDEKTVCVEAHEPAYCEQLASLGFEVVEIPYEKVIPFGGALHCTTLDVYRESACEDYFPKQILGY